MKAAGPRRHRELVYAVGFLALAAVFAIGTGPARAALPGWNVRVKFFDTTLEMPSGKGVLTTDETVTTIFHQGEIIWAFCQYEYAKVSDPKSFSPWSLKYLLDGKVIEPKYIAKYEDPHATPHIHFFTPGPGTHQLECRLDVADDDPSDNAKTLSLVIKPKVAGVDGDLPAPAPQFLSPIQGQKFWHGPSLKVLLRARIPAVPFGTYASDPGKALFANFLEYAQKTPTLEEWHIDLLSIGTGLASYAEVKLASFKGKLDALEFQRQVEEPLPVGRYAARAWLTQKDTSGLRVGPSGRVEFEVLASPSIKDAGGPGTGAAAPPAAAPGKGTRGTTPVVTSPKPKPKARMQPEGRTLPPRLVSARQEGSDRVSLVLSRPGDAETQGLPVEIRLGSLVVGRSRLGAVRGGKEQSLLVGIALPRGTSLPADLEIWAGGAKVGSVRIGAPSRSAPAPVRSPR